MFDNTQQLQDQISLVKETIEKWIAEKRHAFQVKGILPPIYSSFDVRDSGSKVAIVDANVFPAGFNNLDEASCIEAARYFHDFLFPIIRDQEILLLPENHTRNLHYFSNIRALINILTKGNFRITIGNPDENAREEFRQVQDTEGNVLILERIYRNESKIFTSSFKKGMILINNDLTLARPQILENIDHLILPPLLLGWYNRRKGRHFRIFNNLIDELAELCTFDPWFQVALFTEVEGVNFSRDLGIEATAQAVGKLLDQINQKYADHNISEKPYVLLKDNSGTYGIGILSVESSEEIFNLPAKKRKKLIYGKQTKPITSLFLQEGIPTKYLVNKFAAEPVIYSVGNECIGGFMRANSIQGARGNLNSRGMFFSQLPNTPLMAALQPKNKGGLSLYSMLCKISNLAISYELEEMISVKGFV